MKIILGGGGDERTAFNVHQKFYDNLNQNKRVLYIPIALLGYKHTVEDCLNWFKNAFHELELEDISVLTNFNDFEAENLNNYGGIYIGGGNTYKLLKEIYESNFDKKLLNYLQNNGVVFGGSAGAIVFGKSIDTARYEDINECNFHKNQGFGLIEGYSVWCHYTKEDNSKINQLTSEGLKICAISEDSGVFVCNGQMESIGQNVIYFD